MRSMLLQLQVHYREEKINVFFSFTCIILVLSKTAVTHRHQLRKQSSSESFEGPAHMVLVISIVLADKTSGHHGHVQTMHD